MGDGEVEVVDVKMVGEEVVDVDAEEDDDEEEVDDEANGGGGPGRSPEPGAGGGEKEATVGDLERALEGTVETLGDLASLLAKFSYDVQDTLYSKVNDLVSDLAQLDAASEKVDAVLPLDILSAVDRGRNPVQTTYRSLEDIAQVSVAAKSKLSAMRDFRDAIREARSSSEGAVATERAVGAVRDGVAR